MAAPSDLMDKLVALAKRRGFVFPGSEIYGGLANSYEYGPVGTELKKNIIDLWWNTFVRRRTDMVGLDSSIILHPTVWKEAGHTESLTDMMIDCRACKLRTRADHLVEKFLEDKGRPTSMEGKPESAFDEAVHAEKIPCPNCGKFDWTPVRKFNLLFETSIGIVPESQSKAYLRGETAQGIFVSFKNIVQSSRVRLPFGVGQTGKSFRNEITKGNFMFRTLEFEQAEIEYFFDPEETPWEPLYEQWKADMWDFLTVKMGIDPEHLRWRVHGDEERSFYSKRTEDIDYRFPFGFKELWGLAYRTDYDLAQHQKFSGQDLTIADPETGKKILPHVIEPAVGINRLLLMALCDAYREEGEGDKARVVLKLAPALAPYKAAVFPLLKNKPELVAKAKEVHAMLSRRLMTAWDDRGNIGKRYLAQDEIGTPFCVTVDFDTLGGEGDGSLKDTVTVRDRDTMAQDRVRIDQLEAYLAEKLQ